MTLKIAGDIHGAFKALHEGLDPSDQLILLGDFLDFLDYDDLSGMISEFVPKPVIKNVLALIAAEKLEEAKKEMTEAVMSVDDLFGKIEEMAHIHYEQLFSGLPCETHLIWGNVDLPHVLKQHLKPNTHLMESGVVTLDGRQCGFVSGVAPMRYSFGMPGELPRDVYRKRLYDLGPVDHLFVHPPPAIEDLAYDMEANRSEVGNEDILAYIDAFAPKTVHFGHIHNPRASTVEHNDTRLINVGFFKRNKTFTTF